MPKDVVDQFRMADGRLFSEATDEEKSWQPVGSGLTFSENYVLTPERAKMDDNREPRYYACIGFNHCFWPGRIYRFGHRFTNMNVTIIKTVMHGAVILTITVLGTLFVMGQPGR